MLTFPTVKWMFIIFNLTVKKQARAVATIELINKLLTKVGNINIRFYRVLRKTTHFVFGDFSVSLGARIEIFQHYVGIFITEE